MDEKLKSATIAISHDIFNAIKHYDDKNAILNALIETYLAMAAIWEVDPDAMIQFLENSKQDFLIMKKLKREIYDKTEKVSKKSKKVIKEEKLDEFLKGLGI